MIAPVIDIFTRAPLVHRCCRCASPTATQGACTTCVATIAAEAADSHLRNARDLNTRGLCAVCRHPIDARMFVAWIRSRFGNGVVTHVGCVGGGQ